MSISKELLSEVLGEDINDIVNDKTTPKNIFQYEIKKRMLDGSGVAYREINIHELANKCKEWALQQGHILSSWETNPNSGVEAYCRSSNVDRFPFQSTTEPEAIFKACNWILGNKEA